MLLVFGLKELFLDKFQPPGRMNKEDYFVYKSMEAEIFRLAAVSDGSPPVVRRLFEVNSEPHTGTRPSVR